MSGTGHQSSPPCNKKADVGQGGSNRSRSCSPVGSPAPNGGCLCGSPTPIFPFASLPGAALPDPSCSHGTDLGRSWLGFSWQNEGVGTEEGFPALVSP